MNLRPIDKQSSIRRQLPKWIQSHTKCPIACVLSTYTQTQRREGKLERHFTVAMSVEFDDDSRWTCRTSCDMSFSRISITERISTPGARRANAHPSQEGDTMHRSLRFWYIGSLVGLALLVTSTASADRRSSLAGNLLLADQDDVFLYPQLALDYRNLVSIDLSLGGASSANAPIAGQQSQSPSSPTPNDGSTGVTTSNPGRGLGAFDESTTGMTATEASMGGAGLLIFGTDEMAFGIGTHRTDIYGATPQAFMGLGDLQLYGQSSRSAWGPLGYTTPIPAAGSPANGDGAGGGNVTFLAPFQLIDLIFAKKGEGQSFGARLSFGQSMLSQKRLGQDVEDRDSWSTTAMDLVVGYSSDSDMKLDVNLEVGIAMFENAYTTSEQTPNYEDTGSLTPSLSLSSRAILPTEDKSVGIGILGFLHMNTASVTDEFNQLADDPLLPDSRSYESSNLMLELGAGPVYELPDDTKIAAYATAGFGSSGYSQEYDGTTQADVSTTSILLPGIKLSMEHWILGWLALRAGISSRYHLVFRTEEYADAGTPNVSSNGTYYEFLWTTGLGIDLGNFEFNGTLQTPFLLNGPDFLGGQGSGVFALLNASYNF
jgi:hypothetical protein